MGQEFNVRTTTVTRNAPTPSPKSNAKIQIKHVDTNSSSWQANYSRITWEYVDGTSETITMNGNEWTHFLNERGEKTIPVHVGDHTNLISRHHQLKKDYQFVRQDGPRNKWLFETNSGGLKRIVLTNGPNETWSGLVGVAISWIDKVPITTNQAITNTEEKLQELQQELLAAKSLLEVEERKWFDLIDNSQEETNRLTLQKEQLRLNISSSQSSLENVLSQITTAEADLTNTQHEVSQTQSEKGTLRETVNNMNNLINQRREELENINLEFQRTTELKNETLLLREEARKNTEKAETDLTKAIMRKNEVEVLTQKAIVAQNNAINKKREVEEVSNAQKAQILTETNELNKLLKDKEEAIKLESKAKTEAANTQSEIKLAQDFLDAITAQQEQAKKALDQIKKNREEQENQIKKNRAEQENQLTKLTKNTDELKAEITTLSRLKKTEQKKYDTLLKQIETDEQAKSQKNQELEQLEKNINNATIALNIAKNEHNLQKNTNELLEYHDGEEFFPMISIIAICTLGLFSIGLLYWYSGKARGVGAVRFK